MDRLIVSLLESLLHSPDFASDHEVSMHISLLRVSMCEIAFIQNVKVYLTMYAVVYMQACFPLAKIVSVERGRTLMVQTKVWRHLMWSRWVSQETYVPLSPVIKTSALVTWTGSPNAYLWLKLHQRPQRIFESEQSNASHITRVGNNQFQQKQCTCWIFYLLTQSTLKNTNLN